MSTPKILIDPVACDAYGYCAELLPEAIDLDEWGYPIVAGRPLASSLRGAARRAVAACPRRAITLIEQGEDPVFLSRTEDERE
jgi:ferredoxin